MQTYYFLRQKFHHTTFYEVNHQNFYLWNIQNYSLYGKCLSIGDGDGRYLQPRKSYLMQIIDLKKFLDFALISRQVEWNIIV